MLKIAAAIFAFVWVVCPAAAYDAIGSTKPWGTVDVTLQAVKVKGKRASVTLAMQNKSEDPVQLSSLIHFDMLNGDGDKGAMAFDDMNNGCDGMVPPMGKFRCRLTYNFESRPASLSIRVGIGIEADPVFFAVQVPVAP